MNRPAENEEARLVGFGDALALLSHAGLTAGIGSQSHIRVAVGAFQPAPADLEAWSAWEYSAEASIETAISATQISSLIVVVDATGVSRALADAARSVTSWLVNRAQFIAVNLRGRDIYVIGITVMEESDRAVVADAVKNFAWRPFRLGGGTCVDADELRRGSLRSIVAESAL